MMETPVLLVAAFAFKQALRQRLIAVAAAVTGGFLLLYAFAIHLAGGPTSLAGSLFGGAGAILVGVYLSSPLPALLAVLTTAGAVAAEVESGAMQSVLVRPVARAEVVAGKFLGSAALLLIYTLLLEGAILLISRLEFGGRLPHAAEVVGLLCLEALTVVALTVLASTLLPTLAAGAGAILLYGFATIGGVMEQVGVAALSPTLVKVGIVTSLLLPADAMYRRAATVASAGMNGSGLIRQFLGPAASLATPSAAMVVYAGLYTVGLVALAAWIFSRRDV